MASVRQSLHRQGASSANAVNGACTLDVLEMSPLRGTQVQKQSEQMR